MQEWFSRLLQNVFSNEGVAFILSMLPISEIRGGLIFARAVNMNLGLAFLITYIGNILPVPFVLKLWDKILILLSKIPFMRRFVEYVHNKAEKASDKVKRYQLWGLFLLVAIPLPGTGAWTGAMVADLMKIETKKALPIIFAGVAAAGVIMALLLYLIPGLFI